MKEQAVLNKRAWGGVARVIGAVCAANLLLMVGTAYAAGNPEAGRITAFNCAGCHLEPGYRITYPVLYNVPKLGGQHAVYIVNALNEYKTKQRGSTTMQAIAAGLSEQDIQNLAAYFSGRTASSTAAPGVAAGNASKQQP